MPGVSLALARAVWLYYIKTFGKLICLMAGKAGKLGSVICLGDTPELPTRLQSVQELRQLGPARAADTVGCDAVPEPHCSRQLRKDPAASKLLARGCQFTAMAGDTTKLQKASVCSQHIWKVRPFCVVMFITEMKPPHFLFLLLSLWGTWNRGQNLLWLIFSLFLLCSSPWYKSRLQLVGGCMPKKSLSTKTFKVASLCCLLLCLDSWKTKI